MIPRPKTQAAAFLKHQAYIGVSASEPHPRKTAGDTQPEKEGRNDNLAGEQQQQAKMRR